MFELWDTETHNIVGLNESEKSALTMVKHVLEGHGKAYVASLALVLEDASGDARTVALGTALVDRAKTEVA